MHSMHRSRRRRRPRRRPSARAHSITWAKYAFTTLTPLMYHLRTWRRRAFRRRSLRARDVHSDHAITNGTRRWPRRYVYFVRHAFDRVRVVHDVADAARDANSPPRDRSIGGCIVTDGVPRRTRRTRRHRRRARRARRCARFRTMRARRIRGDWMTDDATSVVMCFARCRFRRRRWPRRWPRRWTRRRCVRDFAMCERGA